MTRKTRNAWFVGGVAALGLTVAAPAGEIDPALAPILQTAGGDEIISTIVYLVDQADYGVATKQLEAQRATPDAYAVTVAGELHAIAQATQGPLIATLTELEAQGRVERFDPFWVANMIRVDATAAEIQALANRNDVLRVYYNFEIGLIRPVDEKPDVKGPVVKAGEGAGDGFGGGSPAEEGVVAVRAPEVWAMGITGEGVLVSTLDTGVDGNHPSLAGRWAGDLPAYAGNPEWAFFDPVTNWTFPQDAGTHGTHTMGSVLGGGPGDLVGVAPGAKYIHCAVIDRVSIAQTVADAIASFEWLLNPDGDFLTGWDVPWVCSNSWGVTTGHGYPECDDTFWTFLDNTEAAGIVQLFSAGNEGSGGLRRPSDRAENDYREVAVAAVNGNVGSWPVAGFSSRGPTFCGPGGTLAIKPDISAPGVDVRSAAPGGGYSLKSGTSMASPHVNGVVALMRQACPQLTVDDIKQIIYDTAFDLGTAGEDNDYGWGMIDALEAVNMALGMCGPGPPRADDLGYVTGVDESLLVTMTAIDFDGEPAPPSITYEVISLPTAGGTLSDPGNAHVITVGDLPYELINGGNQVTYTPSLGFWGDDDFQYVADDGGVPPDGGDSDPATISVSVQFGPPVITTPSLPDGFLNFEYGPFQMSASEGQPNLQWETGGELEYEETDLGFSDFQSVGIAQGWHADDNSWSYSLPFGFEFFGVTYNQVWASSNGLLNFGGGSNDWSNSDGELIASTRIATLWDDLRTDQGGDIYIDDSVAGQVTFRWDTVTYSGGNPCNHSCTLYDDGRIRMHYGSGNTGLTPTVGVSSGDGTNYLLSIYNNSNSLTNANSLETAPPSPLPEGMTIDIGGTLGGTPLESGVFEPRIRVTDSLGRTDQVQYTLIINVGEPPCAEDLDGSGDVGFGDILQIIGAWGPCGVPCPEDLSGNGNVDFADILAVIAAWGDCP
ncbi:MAG: S8 family serine peptidase [Planctomycetota bacterium]